MKLDRIIILGSAYPLRGGGLATFNERLARAFQEKGHKVTIFTFSLQYPSLLFPGKTQMSDEAAPNDLDIKVEVNSINPFNWIRSARKIKKLNPDVLVVRYWIPFMAPCLGTISRLVRKNGKTKVLAVVDNIIPHEKRPGDKALSKYFVNSVDGFLTMSESVLKDLKKFDKKKPRVFCNHPLYDNFGRAIPMHQAREFLNLDPDFYYLLFFGFIRDYKGLDLLLMAMANEKIRQLPIKLIVAGEFYSSMNPYLKIIKENKLEDKVILKSDFIANNLVSKYFCASNLVVQPYKDATQSGVTQIAYHFDKPMVVTNVGGLPEMVPHKKAGWVVNPDSEEIAEAVYHIFTSDLDQQLIEGIQEEKKRFSWDYFTGSLLELTTKI